MASGKGSLNSRIAEAVTEYRELELARLDALQAAHWPQAVAGSVRSADRVQRVIDRRMKLLGLDRSRMQDHRPRYLVVSAPDDDEAGYIRQLQAITAMSDGPKQATMESNRPHLDVEGDIHGAISSYAVQGDGRPTHDAS